MYSSSARGGESEPKKLQRTITHTHSFTFQRTHCYTSTHPSAHPYTRTQAHPCTHPHPHTRTRTSSHATQNPKSLQNIYWHDNKRLYSCNITSSSKWKISWHEIFWSWASETDSARSCDFRELNLRTWESLARDLLSYFRATLELVAANIIFCWPCFEDFIKFRRAKLLSGDIICVNSF